MIKSSRFSAISRKKSLRVSPYGVTENYADSINRVVFDRRPNSGLTLILGLTTLQMRSQAKESSRIGELQRQRGDSFKARLHPAIAPIPFVVAVDAATEERAQAAFVGARDRMFDRDGTKPTREAIAGLQAIGHAGRKLLRPEPLAQFGGASQAVANGAGISWDFNPQAATLESP